MSVTHYNGSKGPVEISTMPLRYASNALDKLVRERTSEVRDPEIAALTEHVARLQEEAAERLAAEGGDLSELEGLNL